MNVALALVTGFLAARLLLLSARGLMSQPLLRRENFRGRSVPTAAGLLVALSVLLVEAARSTFGAFGVGVTPDANPYRAPVLFAGLAFALLGLVDDLLGGGEDRGFRGHLGALRRGRVTTGLAKIVGGGAVALFLAAPGNPVSGRRLVADAVLIALAANLGNLLDRAPGRAIKVGWVAWLPLGLVALVSAPGTDARLAAVPVAVVMGAFTGLWRDDLRERLMLGDTGANVLGGVLGLEVVLAVGRTGRNVVLVVLVALNLAAEVVSFSRVIERSGLLTRLDRLGRSR